MIPSYKVRSHFLEVIASIGYEVERIYAVDASRPDKSGDFVEAHCTDPRTKVIRHTHDQGVDGAAMTGYQSAIADDAEIIIQIDGDGQMNPVLIPNFVAPTLAGEADYTKGNRFFNLEKFQTMPKLRLFGNAGLFFLTVISSSH